MREIPKDRHNEQKSGHDWLANMKKGRPIGTIGGLREGSASKIASSLEKISGAGQSLNNRI